MIAVNHRILAILASFALLAASCGGADQAPSRTVTEAAEERAEEIASGDEPGPADLLLLIVAAGTADGADGPSAAVDTERRTGDEDSPAAGKPTSQTLPHGIRGTIPPDPAPDTGPKGMQDDDAGAGETCPPGTERHEDRCVPLDVGGVTPPDPAPDDEA